MQQSLTRDTDLTRSLSDGRPLEFRLGVLLVRRSQSVWVYAIAFGAPLAVAIVSLFVLARHVGPSTDMGSLLSAMLAHAMKDRASTFKAGILAIAVIAAIVFLLLQRRAYLRLTGHGLEYYVPRWIGLGLAGHSTGRYTIPWDAIRAASLHPGRPAAKPVQTLAGYRLVVATDQERLRLAPFAWILPGGPDHRLTLKEAVRMKGFEAGPRVENAPLLQALRERGLKISAEPEGGGPTRVAKGYNLLHSPGLIAQLVLFFGAGLYALVDGVVIRAYRPLESLPLEPFAIVAAVGIVLVAVLGRGVPAVERAGVGVLTVAALVAAVYPGLLRINALTAEPRSLTYRSVSSGRFEPDVRGLPAIDLRDLKVDEYWSQFSSGAEQRFVLLRGVGGFYELDMSPIYASTRAFYAKPRAR